ncbi:MAG: hypothetical protein ACIRZ1_08855, partial [Ligilactobacillus ruminis]
RTKIPKIEKMFYRRLQIHIHRLKTALSLSPLPSIHSLRPAQDNIFARHSPNLTTHKKIARISTQKILTISSLDHKTKS